MKKSTTQSILRGTTIFIVVLLWMLVSPITAFFWTLFLVWAVFKLDSRIIGVGALTLLILIPLALSSPLYEWVAEQLAVYVYYLLCITVVLQILKLRRDSEGDEDVSVPEIENVTTPSRGVGKEVSVLSHIQHFFATRTFSSHTYAVVLFLGATVVILGGMLAPGYILTLDMVWSDASLWSWSTDGFNNGVPIRIALSALGLLFPSWVVQKLMLAGLFFGLLYIPYRFLPFLTTHASRLFAGFLYVLNPFVYTRLLAGQWGVLLGYMCLPLVAYSVARLIEKRDRTSGFIFGGALLLVGVSSIHFLYLSVIISLVWVGVSLVRSGGMERVPLAKASLWGFVLFLAVSTYWLIPALLRDTPLEERFTIAHFEGFSASENHLVPTELNLAVLGGFWGEGDEWRYYFVWPQDHAIFWIVAVLLFFLIVAGFMTMLKSKENRNTAIGLALLAVCAYIVALGAWGGMFTSLNLWLYTHVPGWSGLRDSHKIAGVLALVYVLFAGAGVERCIAYMREKKPQWVRAFVPSLFVLPIVFGMYEFGGFHNQLIPTEYPDTWYAARTVLSEAEPSDKMLVLPWQGYFSLPFANQLVTGNPTKAFFGADQILFSRAIGMEEIYDQETGPTYRSVDTFLHDAEALSTEDIIATLRSHNIRYLFVVVNDAVEDQNIWLLPPYMVEEEATSTSQMTKLKDSTLIQSLLRTPHEILIDADVLLYRFTY